MAVLGLTGTYNAFPESQITQDAGMLKSFGSEFGQGVIRGFLNVGAGVVGTAEYLVPGQQESWLEAKERIQARADEYDDSYGNWSGKAGRILGEALPYMGTAMVAGMAGAGIAAFAGGSAAIGAGLGAASVGFSVEGQAAYDDAIDTGATEDEANKERFIVGTINAAIEAAQITRLLKFHKTGKLSLKSFIKNVRAREWDLVGGDASKITGQVLRMSLEEGIEEAAQEGVSISVPGMLRGEYPRKSDGSTDWGQIMDRVGAAGLGGAFAGAVLGGGGALIGSASEVSKPSDKSYTEAIGRVNDLPVTKDFSQGEKDYWIALLEEQRTEGKSQEGAAPVVSEEVDVEDTNQIFEIDGFRVNPKTITEDQLVIDKFSGAADTADTEANLPSVKEGFLRLYRGQDTETREGAGSFYTPFLQLAENYAKDQSSYTGTVSEIIYMDVPKKIANKYNFTKINKEDLGLTNVAREYQFPQLKQRGEQTDIPALHRGWDSKLVDTVKAMDTSLREVQQRQIKKFTGERLRSAEKILTDPSDSPQMALKKSRAFFKGELGLRFDPLKLDADQVSYYYKRILTSELSTFEKYSAEDGLNALFGVYKDSKGQAKLPEPKQIEHLGTVFGKDMEASLTALREGRGDKMTKTDKIIETLNFSRALLASYDMSAAGRQGLLILPMAPKQWAKAVYQGYRAWSSPEYARLVEIEIKTDPTYPLYKDVGGEFTEAGNQTKGEEVFSSKFARKIPGIEASERAYTTVLNSLRFYTFKKYADGWKGTGKSKADYRDLSDFIRHATGRGDLGGLQKYAHFLNAGFFAPRLTIGRVQAINDMFKGIGGDIKARKLNPTRKIIAADLVGGFAAGMGALALLSMIKGVKVEKDPRSSDFGKVRFGNTRLDFWGGYSQIMRLVARTATGEIKSTVSGDISDTQRGKVLWRFLQSKLSPAAGLAVDLARGETFLGEPLDMSGDVLATQAWQRFVPLFFQDVTDAFHYQGLKSAAIVAPLALHGIGAMTYTPSPSSESARIKDAMSMEVFGREWDTLSPESQKMLRVARPEIVIQEKKAKIGRTNFGRVGEGLREQRKVTDSLVKAMPKSIRGEFKKLDVYLPGLSRRVGSGWYLNDKRYKVYQASLKLAMKTYFSKMIQTPVWDKLDPRMRATLLEETFGDIKRMVLDSLMMNATINDFEKGPV